MADLRIGHGFDLHPLVPGRPLIIGGVNIEYDLGLMGHSDADVLAHAIADSLLGAAGLPDIGQQFPPTDESFRDADSLELLKEVVKSVHNAGWTRIVNIDAVVMAEQPKINPHISQMKERLAGSLGIEPDRIGIKATTCEGLGTIGRGEGIAATAVCLLERDG